MSRKANIRWIFGAAILGAASTILPFSSISTVAAAILLGILMGRRPKSPETLVTSLAGFLGGFLILSEQGETMNLAIMGVSAILNILIYHLVAAG